MPIIGALPNNILNGQPIDATPVMADFNFIVTQTNANAAAIAGTTPFTSPQTGVAATTGNGFPIVSQIQANAFTWCGLSGGTTNALTLTPPIAITAYQPGQTFIFQASATNTLAATVSVSALATLAIQFNGAALVGGEIAINKWYTVLIDASGTTCQLEVIGASLYLGTTGNAVNVFSSAAPTVGQVLRATDATHATWQGVGGQIQSISASVAANALTISASALSLDFRSTTLGSGAVTTVSGTPANLVISSGSTLGTTNALLSRILVIAMNNAGTIELAAVNISGSTALTEDNLIGTTAEGGAGGADSASIVYSTVARSNLAYRVVGYIESTQATAGTWATAPSTVQGEGGQALTSISSIGYGQTYQSVTRVSGTTYFNTTGKPITWYLTANASSTVSAVTIGGVIASAIATTATTITTGTFIIPPGTAYTFTATLGTTFSVELR
jgi:hypothetical protein